MLLAELEVRHSRAVVPTRRVALGERWLPAEPPPGPGGILLGGLVAAHVDAIDDDLLVELLGLIDDLESDRRIPQPRLRHRFQTDVVASIAVGTSWSPRARRWCSSSTNTD